MALVDNCIAYWRMDTNGSIPDSASSYTLTISGATYTSSGKINGAYSYDGTNDYLYRSTASDLNVGTGNYTYNCWIYVVDAADYAAWTTIFCKGGVDTSAGMECITDQSGSYGRICFISKEHAWIRLPTTYDWTTGAWQMLTFTWNGSTAKIYRNGTEITGGTSASGAWNNSVTIFRIGENYQGTLNSRKYFKGKIDEFGIWTRALSGSEITELYNSGAGLTYPFTSGWAHKLNGISAIAKINGIANANIAKVNGQ